MSELELGEEKYQRRAKKVMSRTAMSCGMLRVCSDIMSCYCLIFVYGDSPLSLTHSLLGCCCGDLSYSDVDVSISLAYLPEI